jgi:UDPglucose--hexose-1-phosphate uridylyltransferase
MSELRWNPMLGEWIATATHRQDRTFLPPADYCPLCPTKPGGVETEIPEAEFDIVVFENRFPSLRPEPPEPAIEGSDIYPVRPGAGVCEVVVYTSDHSATLADVSVERIHHLIRVWTDRFAALGALDCVDYVFIFENKGEAIGVTLHHPHGQIYGYSFIPPKIARELEQSKLHFDKVGRCLLCDVIAEEYRDGRRVVAENAGFVAFVPFFARFPFEVHIVARRHAQALSDFDATERRLLAEMMKTVLTAYDRLFGFSLPYIMSMHQRPTDGGDYPHYHFHIEFTPPHRTPTKLKYLAGSESGAGMYINDTLPEETAARLRECVSESVSSV